MYKIETRTGTYFYNDIHTAKAIMYVLQAEHVPADMYKVLPEFGNWLLWHVEGEHVQG